MISEHTVIKKAYAMPKETSIYTAELMAIQQALKEIENLKDRYWTIYLDSQSALHAIKAYKPKHSAVKSIQEILYRNAEKKITLCKVPSHINVKGNELADKEAKKACGIDPMILNRVPYADLSRCMMNYVREEWELQWNNSRNRLHKIKSNIESCPSIPNRRDSVILARLRIGHTRMTHGYLMSRGRSPECCDSELTVEHILTRKESIDYKRNSNYIVCFEMY